MLVTPFRKMPDADWLQAKQVLVSEIQKMLEGINRRCICLYCGEVQEFESPELVLEGMIRHIAVCERHPVRKISELLALEREACAKIADEHAEGYGKFFGANIATAIRSRAI